MYSFRIYCVIKCFSKLINYVLLNFITSGTVCYSDGTTIRNVRNASLVKQNAILRMNDML